MNIPTLLPKGKYDIRAFADLGTLSDGELAIIADELMAFLADANYPCYQAAVDLSIKRQTVFLPIFAKYLSAEDWIWKYWFFQDVFKKIDIEKQRQLYPEIERLSRYVPEDEDEKEVVMMAKKIIAHQA